MPRPFRRQLFVVAVFGLSLLTITVANAYRRIDDAYAQNGAAEMLIGYMQDHDGKWPADWECLEPYFARNNGLVGGWPYSRFQAAVWIDFGADASRLRKLARGSDSIPFDVVHAKSVWSPRFDDGPNGILFRHFRDDESFARSGQE